MNKNSMNNRSKYFNIGMIFSVLIFFFGIGMLGNIASTTASPSTNLVPADTGTPVVIPTDTPIPPLPTPTPIPPQPTPTPIPPQPTPTPIPPQPTKAPPIPQPTTAPPPNPGPGPGTGTGVTPVVPLPPGLNPGGNDGNTTTTPTATVTNTRTPTATATTVVGKTPPVTTPPPAGKNPTNSQPGQPGAGTDAGGPNMLVLSLGIGTPVLLLFGGGLFWLYWRKNHEDAGDLSSPWVSSNNMNARNALSQAPGAFAATASPYGMNTFQAPNAGPTTNMLQPSTLPPFAELAGPLYTPSDLRPITMALPPPFPNQPASDLVAYPPTGDMNPLSFETLNLPHDINEMMKPENAPNPSQVQGAMDLEPQSIPGPVQNSPAPFAAATQLVQPPDVKNDSILEHVMRQAQLGLFVITNPERGLSQGD